MNTKQKLGIVANNSFLKHKIDQPTFESPERIREIYKRLYTEPSLLECLMPIPPQPVALSTLRTVHTQLYLNQIQHHTNTINPFTYCKETYIVQDTFEVASRAVDACLRLTERIMSGDITYGYAIQRPPGHHAEQGQGMGYCIFNNAALAATHLIRNFGLKRILILDFDAHHGNGTQQIFYNSNQVLVMSIHENNLYPKRSGDVSQSGEGSGRGFNINIPVFATYGDEEYSFFLDSFFTPIIEQFYPQFIVASMGYDGHKKDNMSNLMLSTEWFVRVTNYLKKWSYRYCNSRLLFVLEGGYQPEVLAECVLATLSTLLSNERVTYQKTFSQRGSDFLHTEILPYMHPDWKLR